MSECDLGGLGPTRGSPVICPWPWTDHLWMFLPLVLLAPLFGLRWNRSRSAAAILLPTLAIYFLWIPLTMLLGENTRAAERMLEMLAIGLGATGLLVPWIVTGNWWWTWARALIVVIPIECLACLCLSFGGYDLLSLQGPQLTVTLIGSVILISSAVLAARSCHGEFSAERFMTRMLGWLLVCAPLAVLVPVALIEGPVEVLRGLDEILPVIFVLGVAGLILTVPFLLLGLFSGNFRERLRVALERGQV